MIEWVRSRSEKAGVFVLVHLFLITYMEQKPIFVECDSDYASSLRNKNSFAYYIILRKS
jgi:hypothetical protein